MNNIKEIRLINYRGFKDHVVQLHEFNILVGSNCAGKSTIVEALKILSLVVNRHRNLVYKKPHRDFQIGLRYIGVQPSLRNTGLNFETICNQYNTTDPVQIIALFDDNSRIEIYVNPNGYIHAIIFNPSGKIITSKKSSNTLNLPHINILPSVNLLQREEKVLEADYVKSSMWSNLSYTHFRNQLHVFYKDYFESFKSKFEDTWPDAQINDLIMDNNSPPLLSLIVRNKSFAAEIYSMGSGLQIWAQVIWFITVIKNSDIVIFDEPDIYLHADLQQKLIKLIKGAFSQIILTTHSVEIISNSAPSDILIIDKDNKKSNFAADIPTLQRLIQSFGSIQNINYSKYWTTKKIIFVEGDDFKYLKQFYKICFPNNQNTIETIPYIEIGGWGGWDKVKDIASILENSLGERVTAYCILDSDYHTQELIAKRKSEALSSNIHLHIWERKEIESYLLDPNTIYRVIINRSDFSKKPILVDITSFLQKTIDEEAETVLDGLATEIYNENRSKGVKNANEIARSIVSNYKMLGNLSLHVPAKTIISKISDWSTKKYNVSISPYALLNEIKKIEIAPEIINLLQQIVS